MDYDGTHILPFTTPLVPTRLNDDSNCTEIKPKCWSFYPNGMTVLIKEDSLQEFYELSTNFTSQSPQFVRCNPIE